VPAQSGHQTVQDGCFGEFKTQWHELHRPIDGKVPDCAPGFSLGCGIARQHHYLEVGLAPQYCQHVCGAVSELEASATDAKSWKPCGAMLSALGAKRPRWRRAECAFMPVILSTRATSSISTEMESSLSEGR
jgi:hypothetical protein